MHAYGRREEDVHLGITADAPPARLVDPAVVQPVIRRTRRVVRRRRAGQEGAAAALRGLPAAAATAAAAVRA